MTIAACQTHTDVRIVKAQQKNNRRTKNKKKQHNSDAPHDVEKKKEARNQAVVRKETS